MDALQLVLAATDFSPDSRLAARRAARIAASQGAALGLLHVVDAGGWLALRDLLASRRELKPAVLEQARIQLAVQAQQLLDEGHARAVHQDLREGDPLQQLLGQARTADLLVIGAHGSHAPRDLALGTLADRLSRSAERPLLVVRNEPAAEYRQVLVPVDYSDASREAVRAAQRVAPAAALHLLHAYDLAEEGKLLTAGVSDEAIAAHREQRRWEAQAGMDALVADLGPGARASATVCPGDIRMVMLEVARDRGCDLIALGKQGQSRLGDLFLGSVTVWALEHAQADVLVVPRSAQG
ncbi:universal stress protein [Ramlibacter tataouinensis]|uniref:universal stress protein n=1 Tax=Ramlibacter tataouinensis TaxID=94132 RepID=UPI0022F3CC28|nr:universal stress protein [Ramlibacter tataouinensis]WBY01907.1 universal stress protein [Ramlibacter tataouinensis]